MNNQLGFILSFVLVFGIIGVATILQKKSVLSKEGSRKFIHVGVSNWWILAMVFFDSLFYAALVPFLFIIINYIVYRYEALSAMEGQRDRSDLGTVYFPVSLLILTLFSFGYLGQPFIGAIGILIMGYGDGLAALIGQRFGRHPYNLRGAQKTFEGSCTMFLVSFLVSYLVLGVFRPENLFLTSMALALVATVSEATTPYGLDNLTVPLITSFTYYLFSF